MPPHSREELLRHPAVWRAGERATGLATCSSGHRALDAALPGGGWPLGALTEILSAHRGIGEVSLLLPALAALAATGRCSLWIDPPAVPYAPALAGCGLDPASVVVVRTRGGAERCWAAEQALRSPACSAALLWLGEERDGGARALRRLQIAAERGGSLGFVFRPAGAVRQPSPAALRLALAPRGAEQLSLRVLRCRGGWPPGAELRLARISHRSTAAGADPLVLTCGTPCRQLDVGSATPSPASSPCAPSGRRLGALASPIGGISGLAR